jgi:hypothetical protein
MAVTPKLYRISKDAMSEVEDALKGYYASVESSDLSQSSQATYIDMANNFVRWLRIEFIPGSRKAPYRVRDTKVGSEYGNSHR